MFHQEFFCLEHGKPIISFCISKHNCPERRLCNECINSNHNNQDQAFILLIDDFQKQLQERLIGYQKGEPCQMLKLVKEFQDQITKIFQVILTSVELVLKKFEEFDKNIYEMKIKLKTNSFLSFSQTDKQMMIEIVRDKLYCNEEQNAFRNKLEQISEQWRSYLEDSVQQLTYKERIDDNIWIEGLKVMGYRQGDYYYCYENGSKELAGTYELGKENGLWKIILGQKYLPCHIPEKTNSLQKNQFPKWNRTNKYLFKGKLKLIYSGDYRNGLKFGLWITLYENQQIGGGFYDDNGNKQGKWIDLHENFWNGCQVLYIGEYKNGLRFGSWTTIFRNDRIGGGIYDDKGMKTGKWLDLHENFSNDCEVVFSGEYSNGLRQGRWTTIYEKTEIGGGNYNKQGMKSGYWTDVHEDFQNYCHVYFTGNYRNGLRFGEWQTLFENKQIGGGNYDDRGVKQGNWIDLHGYFLYGLHVLLSGEYRNGQRFGLWTTLYENQQIGGGYYNENGMKTGNWTDLYENFQKDCSVVFSGEYKNGSRFGRWVTIYQNKEIGGGSYDDKGVKFGAWSELHERFYDHCQVVYSGQYCNGLQIGEWTTFYQDKKIGGGSYNDKGLKSGNWADLHENFQDFFQITFCGEYKDGLRIGRWDKINLETRQIRKSIFYKQE